MNTIKELSDLTGIPVRDVKSILGIVEANKGKIGLINKSGNAIILRRGIEIEFPECCLIVEYGDKIIGIKKHIGRFNWTTMTTARISTETLERIMNSSKSFEAMNFIGDCFVGQIGKKQFLFSIDGDLYNEVDRCSVLSYIGKFNQKTKTFEHDRCHKAVSTDSIYYLVEKDSKRGVIDNHGTLIVPFEYDCVGFLTSKTILAWDGKLMRIYSIDGSEHTKPYELIEARTNSGDSELHQFYVYMNRKVGLISYQNGIFDVLRPCVYDIIDYHFNSTYPYENKHDGSFTIDGIGTNHRILGSNGNYLEKPKDISWMTDFSYSGIAVALKGDYFGIINSQQNTLRDYSYDTIFIIDAFHFLLSKNNRVELIRFNRAHEESVIMDFPGLVVSRLSTFTFRVLRSGQFFVFKYNEEKESLYEIFEKGYDNVFGIDESFIVVEENGLYGCFNNEGRKLLDIKYESIAPVKNRKEYYPKRSAIDLTVNKLVIGYYPLDNIGEYLCDLYDIESGNLLHIPTSWFYDETFKLNHPESNGIVRPGNWFIVNYVDENNHRLGVYMLFNTHYKQIYVTSINCQQFEGPFDKIEPFYNSGAPWYRSFLGLSTYRDGKRGLIRLEPFDAIPCDFDCPVCFVDGSSRFWIFEKSNGEESIKTVYDSINKLELDLGNVVSIDSLADNYYRVSVLSDDNELQCGLFNNSFKQIVPMEFSCISYCRKGQFIVNKENRVYGIIDESGHYVYPLSPYRIVFTWPCGDNRGYYKFYDENNVLNAVSDDGYYIHDIVDDVDDDVDKEFIPNSRNHYITKREENGLLTVRTSFGEIYTDILEAYTEDDISILKTKDGYVAINTEKRITPSLHEVITFNKSLGYLSVKDGRRRQFIDLRGELLGEIEGDYAGCFLYKDAGVFTTMSKKEDGKLYYRLLSLDGAIISDTEFSYIGSYHENYATCVINSESPIDKSFFKRVEEEYFFVSNRNNYGQWGIINNRGDIVIPMKFDYIRPVKNGQAIYVKDHRFGIINLKDKYRTAPIFKYLFNFSEGLCAFREYADESDGIRHYQFSDCGLINEKGQIVVPAAYYRIYSFKDGIANVESSSNFRNQIDHEGNLLHEWKKLPSRDDPYDEYDEGYTQSELDDIYRGAYEGDPSAQWNND